MCEARHLLVYCDALNRKEKNFEGNVPGPLLLDMDWASLKLFAVAENLLQCRSGGVSFRAGVKKVVH